MLSRRVLIGSEQVVRNVEGHRDGVGREWLDGRNGQCVELRGFHQIALK